MHRTPSTNSDPSVFAPKRRRLLSNHSVAGPLQHAWRSVRGFLGPAVVITVILGIFYLDRMLNARGTFDFSREGVSYGLLFVAGLLTGFHCVGMCGALVVGYVAKASPGSYRGHLLYGLGKTVSYTVIGGLFGALGAIITFTPTLRGIAGVIAGVFLILFGLSMLHVFKGLDRFGFKTPAFVTRHLGQAYRRQNDPFVIGLLNGLMILCGPLQAMYVLAAGTGSAIAGAKALFVFGLGTLPVMLGFGLLASMLSRQMAPKLLKASGYVVLCLGLIMFDRGLVMTGSGYDFGSIGTAAHEFLFGAAEASSTEGGVQIIRMRATRHGYIPNRFRLQPDIPVRWIIDVEELTYCNSGILVPKLGIDVQLQRGVQVIEFTPQETGTIGWSCWMGMLPGSFTVRPMVPGEAPASGLVPRAAAALAKTARPLAELPERTVLSLLFLVIGAVVLTRHARHQWADADRRARFRESLALLHHRIPEQRLRLAQVADWLDHKGPPPLAPAPVSSRDCEVLADWAQAEGWTAEHEWLMGLRRRLHWADRIQAGENPGARYFRSAAGTGEAGLEPAAVLALATIYDDVDHAIEDYLAGRPLPPAQSVLTTVHGSGKWFRLVGLLCVVVVALWTHGLIRSWVGTEKLDQVRALVHQLALTDFSLFTEARYTRHPSQADRFAPFQDHPLSFDHFPSGSFVEPPTEHH